MLPNFVPAGTSGESFFERVLPDAHRSQVPADASAGEYVVRVCIANRHPEDDRTDEIDLVASYLYTIHGREISATKASGADMPRVHLSLVVDQAALDFFLADWSGPRRFAPSFVPAQGVQLITDPRVLKRLAQATGRIELRLADFEGGDARLLVSAAGGRKHALDTYTADATIETKVTIFEELLAGRLRPDEAIADAHVTVRGKKLVAMQFAFALAPFFPGR
ncbi:MAG TPA: SCP2 sterol-binding domain-containing protein [Polyangiaceae bacterium]|nr:SCP2 sterol-binding domain-containing protein [Polyangiaceae bacterium]